MRRISRRWLLVAAAGVGLTGCLSPTLPLPPPSRPDVSEVGTNRYLLRGAVSTPAFVLVLNKRTNAVNGVLTTGDYAITVTAQPKDPMQLWYETGPDVSDIVEFDIPENAPPSPDAGTKSDAGP